MAIPAFREKLSLSLLSEKSSVNSSDCTFLFLFFPQKADSESVNFSLILDAPPTVSLSMSSPHTSEDSPARPRASKVGQKSLHPSFFVYGWLSFHGTRCPVSLYPLPMQSGCAVSQKGFLPTGGGKTPCSLLPRLDGVKKPLTVSAAASSDTCPRWA